MKERVKTKKIYVGDVAVGGDAPISVQSMTYSDTQNVTATVEQINRLHFAGADMVRVAVPDRTAISIRGVNIGHMWQAMGRLRLPWLVLMS